MSKDNGGPVFPFPAIHGRDAPTGMTLRDYFAAKATEEDIAYQILVMAPRNGFGEVMSHKVSRAAARFAHADDMLAERAK